MTKNDFTILKWWWSSSGFNFLAHFHFHVSLETGTTNREMLTRVYATAWEDPAQLKQYKNLVKEAKKRDHRLLGKNLDLFSIQEKAGGGLVFWHPKGSAIRTEIENFWR